MYDISKQVCTSASGSSGGTIVYTAKEGNFLLPATDVLVYWKNDLHWIPAKQIGHGMKLLVLYPEYIREGLVPEAFAAGMCIYQEYDETSGTMNAYIYKYAGGQEGVMRIQDICRKYALSVDLNKEKGFLRLVGGEKAMVNDQNHDQTFAYALSYFLGVCIAYGKPKQIVDNQLVTRHVGLPLVGSIVVNRAYIQQIINLLGEKGIFLHYTQQQQQVGSLVQMTIHDQELLTMIQFLWGGTPRVYPEWYSMVKTKIKTLCPLQLQIPNSVLKFIGK